MLFRIEKMTKTGSKITLLKIKFSMNMCKNLNKAEIDNLSDTARDFSYFLKSFGNKLKVCNFVNLWMVQDTIQSLNTVTCGIVQISFYNKLFDLDVNSKIQNNKKLTKKKKEKKQSKR